MRPILFALPFVVGLASTAALPAQPTQVIFETSKGEIVVELYPDKAPATVENFLTYVRDGHYDGTIVYRVNSFLIQAGSRNPDFSARPTRDPIPNEADNGLTNSRGAIGMARWGPHTATAEYYINTKDNPHLDHREKTEAGWGYCVFGKVVRGMDVVDAIAAIPTRPNPRANLTELPQEEVLIRKVTPAALGTAVEPGEEETAEPALRIEGKLTDEGVECPAMRGADGTLYTLAGDLEGFKAGDEVWVEGEVAEMSICQQGTTIAVDRIGRRAMALREE